MPTSGLTHQRMHEIVDSGEGFLHDGLVISKKEDIPAPEALAVTDTDKKAVLDALKAEQSALARRIASLSGSAPTYAEADTTTNPKPVASGKLPPAKTVEGKNAPKPQQHKPEPEKGADKFEDLNNQQPPPENTHH